MRSADRSAEVESIIYRIGVHAPDSVSCQRENLSSIWWDEDSLTLTKQQLFKCITLFVHFLPSLHDSAT